MQFEVSAIVLVRVCAIPHRYPRGQEVQQVDLKGVWLDARIYRLQALVHVATTNRDDLLSRC